MKNIIKIRSYFFITILICVTNSCKLVDRADKNFEYYEYTKAIPKYKKVLNKDSTNTEVWARLGDCYRLNNQTIEAEECYAKAVQNPNTKSIYKLYYAQMMINNTNYNGVHKWIEDYSKSDPDDSRGAMLDSAINHINDFLISKDKFQVQKLNINTSESEYGPVLYKGGIVFNSSRESEAWANRRHSWTGRRYYSVYYSKGRETNFEPPVVFLKGIQTKYNNSSVCFNSDETEMIMTRNNVENEKMLTSKDSTVKLKLYISFLKDGIWSEAISFKYNNDQYSCAHPAFSPDGTKLYFSSDMPGTIGGMDLWVCKRTPDGWSEPVNLGSSVNTKGNEVFPTISDDGTIYFSSNGLEGLGGLDIFLTSEKSGSYSKAINAGAPINSSDDDFGLVWDTKNKIGYFSSNRIHQGYNDDIFCITNTFVDLTGLVSDKNTDKVLDNSNIRVIENDSIGEVMNIGQDGFFRKELNRNNKYEIIVERSGYKTDTIKLSKSDFEITGDSIFIKCQLEKEEPMISIDGVLRNNATGNPVDSARIMLINFTCQDTLIATVNPEGYYSFTNLNTECRYRIIAEAKYCKSNYIDTTSTGIMESKNIRIDIGIYFIGENIVLNNIYYDLNKYNIRPDAAKELDKLVELMKKYPLIEIELGSHTDSRGSYSYNMKLSQKRAKAAVEYLVNQGVDHKRISAQGYGESKPVNKCINEGDTKVYCTEAEYQLNRRTEIKILSTNWTACKE